MNIKIGKAEFSKHEFLLLLLSLGFFALIFFGSFKFGFMGKIFPLLIGGPGLILVFLYLVSGFLPPGFNQAMKRDTQFRLFGLMPGKEEDESAERTPAVRRERFSFTRSYTVLGLTIGYFFCSYLFGFYVSTFAFTVCYLLIFRRKQRDLLSLISGLLLLTILMATVFLFDYSFGYDFGKAAVTKWLQL